MIEECSPALSEDRGHTSNVDGPEALAVSICDMSYKLTNLKIILLFIHCVVDMHTSQARLSYLAMYDRCRNVRAMVSENRWATLVCKLGEVLIWRVGSLEENRQKLIPPILNPAELAGWLHKHQVYYALYQCFKKYTCTPSRECNVGNSSLSLGRKFVLLTSVRSMLRTAVLHALAYGLTWNPPPPILYTTSSLKWVGVGGAYIRICS